MALTTGSTFVWHELYTPNLGAAIDFYKNALGFGTQEMDMGPQGKYTMLTRGEKAVCGMLDTTTMPGHDIPPHWAVYLSVDDVDARLTKVKSNGGTVVVEPMTIPTIGRMALIQDPTGAHIWLFKGESS